MASPPGHVSRVRALYKIILRLHKGLPEELRYLGDQYVRDEFRRHKHAEPQFVRAFMVEWTDYAVTIAKQMGAKKEGEGTAFGKHIETSVIESLSDGQVGQLTALLKEIRGVGSDQTPRETR